MEKEWHVKRPDSFDFGMDFLGGSEAIEIRAYVEQLEKAASLSRWISLKDQEPPKGMSVLIMDGKLMAVVSWRTCYKDGTPIWELEGIGGYEVETDWEDRDITHWMPLPGLPGPEGKHD